MGFLYRYKYQFDWHKHNYNNKQRPTTCILENRNCYTTKLQRWNQFNVDKAPELPQSWLFKDSQVVHFEISFPE